MTDKSNPYYCPHIYKNIYIEKTPGDTVITSACCVNESSSAYNVINFYSNPYLKEQRQRIQNQEKISNCNACWQQEELNNFSLRNASEGTYRYEDPYKEEMLGIDYNVSPICNAKCIMCSSYYSSAWAAEDAKFGIKTERTFKEVSSSLGPLDLDYQKLQKVYFNGGEPLLSTDMVDMLKVIKEQQGTLNDLDIRFNTNGSVFPSDEVLSLLSEARSLIIFFSIDAVNEQFEYIRNPLKWAEVEKNIIELSKKSLLRHIDHVVGITCTTGVHNALEVSTLFKWYQQHRSSLPCLKDFVVQPVNGSLSLSNGTSAEVRQVLLDNISTGQSFYDTIRRWISSGPVTNDTEWKNLLNMIDQRRGSNWREILTLGKLLRS